MASTTANVIVSGVMAGVMESVVEAVAGEAAEADPLPVKLLTKAPPPPVPSPKVDRLRRLMIR